MEQKVVTFMNRGLSGMESLRRLCCTSCLCSGIENIKSLAVLLSELAWTVCVCVCVCVCACVCVNLVWVKCNISNDIENREQ